MGRVCSICTAICVDEINEALRKGASVRTVAARFGLDFTAVSRHQRRHLGMGKPLPRKNETINARGKLTAKSAAATRAAAAKKALATADPTTALLPAGTSEHSAGHEWAFREHASILSGMERLRLKLVKEGDNDKLLLETLKALSKQTETMSKVIIAAANAPRKPVVDEEKNIVDIHTVLGDMSDASPDTRDYLAAKLWGDDEDISEVETK